MSSEQLNNNNSSNEAGLNSVTEKVLDVSLPPSEWFDEMFGPSISVLSDIDKTKNQTNGTTARQITKTPRSKDIKTEVVDISDDDEQNKTVVQPINLSDEFCDVTQAESIASLTSHNDLELTSIDDDIQPLEMTTEANALSAEHNITNELKKIVLTKSRLNVLAEASAESFHKAVIGCFVRVHVPGIAEHFKDLLFFDQIENVFEPMSFQHFWFNRRFRLVNFGDFEIGNIFDVEVNDNDIRKWICYVEAKDGKLPTMEFIKQKEAELFSAMKQIKENPKQQNKIITISPSKVRIKQENLEQITLGIDSLRNLAKLDFDRFRQTVEGCFVCIQAIRKDKPPNCQYHICPIKKCIRSGKEYKIKNVAVVDYQLVLPYYGKYNLNWLRDDFSIVNEDGFRLWIEDMNFWNEEIPNLDQIRNKAAILQLMLTEAATLPTLKEKDQNIENEKYRKMPVKSARDLDGCLLTHQRLKKLSILCDQIELLNMTMTGCFVRLKIGPTKQFKIDQVKRVEMVEVKEEKDKETSEISNESKKKELVLHLNSIGTITMSNLFKVASQFKIEEQEFREWLRIMHRRHVDEILPTKEFLDRKQQEIERALKLAVDKEDKEDRERQITRSEIVNRVSRPNFDKSRHNRKTAQYESTSERTPVNRPRSAGPTRGRQWSGYKAYQAYSTRPVVHTTPGVKPGWTSSGMINSINSTDLYNSGSDMLESLRQQQQQTDNLSLLSSTSDHQFFPSVNNSILGKRSTFPEDARRGMLDLWKTQLKATEQRQREQISLIDDEPTSDFRVPFVRGGTILNDRSYETELRSTPNFYSSSPIQKSAPQYVSGGLFTPGSRRIDVPSRYQSNSTSLLNDLAGEQIFSNASTSSAARTVAELLSLYDPYNTPTLAAKRSRPLSPLAPPVQRFF
uniref:Plus3 domain-containing protein n=1 Tax=Meloidogyne enterolobii TaxID=390850 RepID=A0A6V7V2Y2_MELEN|nr:unnamed protein product [Meloidogyne enterolobii]